MPNFLIRKKRGTVIGTFKEPQTVSWTSDAASATIRATNRSNQSANMQSSQTSGSFTLSAQGDYQLSYQFHFNSRGSVTVSVDGAERVNENNHRGGDTTQIEGPTPCAAYEIPDARTQCRPGYSRSSRREYAFRYEYKNSPTANRRESGQTAWAASDVAARALVPSSHFLTGRQQGYVSRTVYFCEPSSPNCRELVTVPNTAFNRIIQGVLSVTVTAPPPPEPVPQPQPQTPQIVPPVIPQIQQQTFDYTKAKYRVISPSRIVQTGNQLVPEIRYMSVRELTAPEVSNLVARGFSVESVPVDTPLVEGTEYGPSVVANSKALNPNSNQPLITVQPRRERMGVAAAVGGVERAKLSVPTGNWRDNNRRVVY